MEKDFWQKQYYDLASKYGKDDSDWKVKKSVGLFGVRLKTR